jgi:protein-disulfide isomerase
MADALFAQMGAPQALSNAGFVEAASSIGLNMGEFTTCMEDGRYNDIIRRNIRVAQGSGVKATPTFFINGRKFEGALPLANFQQQIEALLN